MRPSILVAAVAVVSMAAAAQANDFKRYYEPIPDTGPIPFATDRRQPEIVHGGLDAWNDIAKLWEKGYRPIGDARFNAEWENDGDALKFARKLGAGYVVRYTKYLGSHETTRTITTPQSSTTPLNVRVNGAYGLQIGTLTGTMTTRWTETETVPYTYTLFGHTAVYFALLEKRGSGLYLIPPTKEGAAVAGTDQGGQVLAVRDGSPAYNADILPGDVIVALDGQGLPTYSSFNKIIAEAGDAPILVTLYRKHVQRQIAMVIPPEWRMAGHMAPARAAKIDSVPQR